MKLLTCEMCGSTDMLKEDGMLICQTCGAKYLFEETVKIDNSSELSNLYQIARRAKDDNNSENAAKYYDMILVKDPNSWEAYFYTVYFKAKQCKIAQIESAGNSIVNCIDSVLNLIKDHVSDKKDQIKAIEEIVYRCTIISSMLYDGAKNHYSSIDSNIQYKYTAEMVNNCFSAIQIMYTLGDNIVLIFKDYKELDLVAASAWKNGITKHNDLMYYLARKKENKDIIMEYVAKIKKYDEGYYYYQASEKAGCYIATAVYGSYDCPQVWTLRRYRDCTLSKTWYGRTFIHIYYTISPTLVKLFGHTEWFNNIGKTILNKIILNLQSKGVKDTPYKDKK